MGYALRNDRYRYVAWYKNRYSINEQDIIIKELYDYKSDPDETVNIVGIERALADEFQSSLNIFFENQSNEKNKFKATQKIERSNESNNSNNVNSPINLLKNPGFEKGTQGWNVNKGCPIYSVNNNARSGESALRFEGTRCGVFQNINGLKSNTEYKVTAYMKSENNEAVLLKVRFYGGEDITRRYNKSEYGEVTATFKTGPENTTARIALLKYVDGGTGRTWFDDLSVIEIGTQLVSEEKPIREILTEKNYDNFYFGATISAGQLDTDVEKILANNFNMTVPENAVKQSVVHPDPDTWDWTKIDAILDMAKENDLSVRLHGPISPQSSRWAKHDDRKPVELENIMNEFLIEQCKRFNNHPNVKWMDVVNETITRDGEWFGPKKGVTEWENPWTIIGSDNDKNSTPIYISRSFEIAQKYAPNINLVFNQHGGMEEVMWERVKETIMYLKDKGLRVDGIGWQAHLSSRRKYGENEIQYLSDLIDWSHQNNLEFHITEMDYKIFGDVTKQKQEIQAKAYSDVLKTLLSKKNNGLVTFNTWGIVDRVGIHTDKSRFIFDLAGNPKLAYYKMKNILEETNSDL